MSTIIILGFLLNEWCYYLDLLFIYMEFTGEWLIDNNHMYMSILSFKFVLSFALVDHKCVDFAYSRCKTISRYLFWKKKSSM